LNVIANTGRPAVGFRIQKVYPGANVSTGRRRHSVTMMEATDADDTEDPK
jgi:hypothetical protein